MNIQTSKMALFIDLVSPIGTELVLHFNFDFGHFPHVIEVVNSFSLSLLKGLLVVAIRRRRNISFCQWLNVGQKALLTSSATLNLPISYCSLELLMSVGLLTVKQQRQ